MARAAARFDFARARPARLWWEDTLRLAQTAAVAPTHDATLHLNHAVIRPTYPFPVPGASATMAADAFKGLVRAFSLAGTPQRQEAIAPALTSAAAMLQRLIDQERDAAACLGRAVMGEGD